MPMPWRILSFFLGWDRGSDDTTDTPGSSSLLPGRHEFYDQQTGIGSKSEPEHSNLPHTQEPDSIHSVP